MKSSCGESEREGDEMVAVTVESAQEVKWIQDKVLKGCMCVVCRSDSCERFVWQIRVSLNSVYVSRLSFSFFSPFVLTHDRSPSIVSPSRKKREDRGKISILEVAKRLSGRQKKQ